MCEFAFYWVNNIIHRSCEISNELLNQDSQKTQIPQKMEACTNLRELGPPPDFILNIPPPPFPENMELSPSNESFSPCGSLCGATLSQGAELVELTRRGIVANDDTWVFVLLACGLLVLVCSSLVAVFLVKNKESRGLKVPLHEEQMNASKTCETVLYPPMNNEKILWATLTPKGGTQHYTTVPSSVVPLHKNSFENTAFDADDYLKKSRVSSPTRIENPNIPPLNLYPSLSKNTLGQALL